MGIYINIGNSRFQSIRNSEYVDKSGLIAIVNGTLSTERRFSCVSRSRRFGKSMAAIMLCAYYDHSCNSRELFLDLDIARDPSFERHLNKYPVLYLDMTAFVTKYHDDPTIISRIDAQLREDVSQTYPAVETREGDDLMDLLVRITARTQERFIFIIDEWDAICREFKPGSQAMDMYVNWLRRMFKDISGKDVFAGVYLTGILPIKKYKTESALNNFTEYSMVDPRRMAAYFGFTQEEVKALAVKYGMDFEELQRWYDGYQIGAQPSMFNPNSVMQALDSDWCTSYWGKTGSYEAVAAYIKMNFDGLKDDIIYMLAGGRCKVDTTKFQNDISIVQSRDDVLTVLIHLGYLSFDRTVSECYIPNREVWMEMKSAVEDTDWTPVVKALRASETLLQATLDGDARAVACGVDAAHDENTSILSYNNENSLACVLSIAYYAARNNYLMHRELPSGKGFADIVLYPRKNVDSPAVVLELKFDNSADSAIEQIKRKEYPAKLADHSGNLLLVGVAYDRKTKQHSCVIERA
ncbi:MAG: AAA family ATPase [Bacteroidales bacterium]|nr:AAA family ATPase [Bacteroidales bacterium]